MKSQHDTETASTGKRIVLRWEWEVFFLFALIASLIFGFQAGLANALMAFSGLTAVVAPILMALRRLK